MSSSFDVIIFDKQRDYKAKYLVHDFQWAIYAFEIIAFPRIIAPFWRENNL